MLQLIADDKAARDANFYGSPRHQLEIDYIPYMTKVYIISQIFAFNLIYF